MNLIISSILISIFIIFYYLMIKVFMVLFRITGLTKEKAHFQVISLLTNSGYTTAESELVTSNASRRKIAKIIMITGMIFNVFIASLLINILISINVNDKLENLKIVGITAGCLVGLIIIIKIPFVSRGIETVVEKIATKIRKKGKHQNVIVELDAYGQKSICEVYVTQLPHELKDRSIQSSCLKSRYNIIVLLVQRKKRILDVKPDLVLQDGDKIVLFGKISNIKELFDIEIQQNLQKENEILTNKIEVIDNYGSNALTEIEIVKLPNFFLNKTVAESNLKKKYDINLLMIKRDGKEKLVDADTMIEIGDKVTLIGPYEHIKSLFQD